MRRYFLNEKLEINQDLTIQGDLYHHIFDVCRLQQGQHFELINESGWAYLVVVLNVGKKSSSVKVLEERSIPSLKHPHIHLYLSFPKVPTFESVVEKSVEMGVKTIIPFLSDYSHIRTKSQFPSEKIQRWKKIILQAMQQSARSDLLQIQEVQTLTSILESLKSPSPIKSLNVIAYEGESPCTLKDYLKKSRAASVSKSTSSSQEDGKSIFQKINVFVGSEGGFSDQEIETFKKLDLVPVTLGDQVLRVETACMTLVSSLKYEFEI